MSWSERYLLWRENRYMRRAEQKYLKGRPRQSAIIHAAQRECWHYYGRLRTRRLCRVAKQLNVKLPKVPGVVGRGGVIHGEMWDDLWTCATPNNEWCLLDEGRRVVRAAIQEEEMRRAAARKSKLEPVLMLVNIINVLLGLLLGLAAGWGLWGRR